MIFGNFDKLNGGGVPAAIQSLIEDNQLSLTKLNQLDLGLYEIENTGVTYLIKEFSTDYRENRPAEFHEDFIDLQLLLEGKETIYFDHSHDSYLSLTNPKPDVFLIDPSELSNKVDLKEGDFAIFLTNEPHQALCSEEGVQTVKKVVFKIPKLLLNNS